MSILLDHRLDTFNPFEPTLLSLIIVHPIFSLRSMQYIKAPNHNNLNHHSSIAQNDGNNEYFCSQSLLVIEISILPSPSSLPPWLTPTLVTSYYQGFSQTPPDTVTSAFHQDFSQNYFSSRT